MLSKVDRTASASLCSGIVIDAHESLQNAQNDETKEYYLVIYIVFNTVCINSGVT